MKTTTSKTLSLTTTSLLVKKIKTCKSCAEIKIYKQGMCYSCFRNYANEKLREWHLRNKDKYKQYEQNTGCAFSYWRDNNIRKEKNNPAYRNGLYTKKSLSDNKHKTNLHLAACRRYRVAFRKDNDYDYCELCGTSNSPKFETHHIVYASEAPMHKELHNFKNLIYLCIGCHNKLHSKKLLRNDLVKERGLSELFDRNLFVYEKNNIT